MINQEEYEILKGLDDKWKWIARDKKGELCVYNKKPVKLKLIWSYIGLHTGHICENDFNKNEKKEVKEQGLIKNIKSLAREVGQQWPHVFQFIKWEDKKPYSIAELIEEYEQKRYRFRLGNLETSEFVDKSSAKSYTVFSLVVEEDEEMKKDKEWLKDEVARIYDARDYWSVDDLRDEILDSINELDEPEVLSQELLVIPKYVADFIEDLKSKKINLLKSIYEYTHSEDITNYIREQGDVLIRAWLDGFTVEKEQKYRVLDRNITLLGRINGFMLTTVEILKYYPEHTPTFDFTEQEIKDYNKSYWAFAVPVEELEE